MNLESFSYNWDTDILICPRNLYFIIHYLLQHNDVNSRYIRLHYACTKRKFYRNLPCPKWGTPCFEVRYIAGSTAWGIVQLSEPAFFYRKRFYFSVLGYSDVALGGRKIFGKVPFQLLNIPQVKPIPFRSVL